MLTRILPKQFDNNYQGNSIAKYVFIFITIFTIARSLIHTFYSDGGAQSITSIPLNSYSTAASDTIILIFSLWGLSQLILSIIYIVIFYRYQSMIPLLYLLMFIEYSGRLILFHLKPIITIHTAPGAYGNYYDSFFFINVLFINNPQEERALKILKTYAKSSNSTLA